MNPGTTTTELFLFGSLFLIHGVYELRQGWMMLKTKKYILDFVVWLRIGLVEIFLGEKRANQYKRQLLKKSSWKLWGSLSISYGLFAIGYSVWWILLGFNCVLGFSMCY